MIAAFGSNRSSWALAVGALLFGVMLSSSGVAFAEGSPPPARFADGQKIEVREGDTWSSATILKHEGRKYLVHYEGGDAGTDEWVTTDRMRSAGPAAAGVPTQPSTAAPRPAAKPAAPKKVFSNGQQVEVKSGPFWKKAVVVNHRGEWLLVGRALAGSQRRVGRRHQRLGQGQPVGAPQRGPASGPARPAAGGRRARPA